MIRREVKYRYWCLFCQHGSPGSYPTPEECEPWRAMHENTNYHADVVAHFWFLHLTCA